MKEWIFLQKKIPLHYLIQSRFFNVNLIYDSFKQNKLEQYENILPLNYVLVIFV